jgi:hypothetical protein
VADQDPDLEVEITESPAASETEGGQQQEQQPEDRRVQQYRTQLDAGERARRAAAVDADRARRRAEDAEAQLARERDQNARSTAAALAAEEDAAKARAETAKRALADAQNAGDTDKIVEASDALIDARAALRSVTDRKAALPQPQERQERPTERQPEERREEPQQPQMSPEEAKEAFLSRFTPKTRAFIESKPWFFQDQQAAGVAFKIGEQLDRRISARDREDEYLAALDERLAVALPDYYPDQEHDGGEPRPNAAQPARRVAPVTGRSTTPPARGRERVRLTQEQVDIGRTVFNMEPEEYAAELRRIERGEGVVNRGGPNNRVIVTPRAGRRASV